MTEETVLLLPAEITLERPLCMSRHFSVVFGLTSFSYSFLFFNDILASYV
jgi:hypothetical protein